MHARTWTRADAVPPRRPLTLVNEKMSAPRTPDKIGDEIHEMAIGPKPTSVEQMPAK